MFESFISQLYQSILGRPADSTGMSYWATILESGAMSASEITAQFTSSEEYATFVEPVARLYLTSFNRAPDAAGLAYWVNAYRGGATLNSIVQEFASSGEYTSIYSQTTDVEFVTRVYENALNRAPDAVGLQFWINVLAEGVPRFALIQSFTESVEITEVRGEELDCALLQLALTGVSPTLVQVRASLPVQSWPTLIEGILSGPDYNGTDVPGVDRYVPPEPAPQPLPDPVPVPVPVPESDPDPAPDTTPPTIMTFTALSGTTLSVSSSEAGVARLVDSSETVLATINLLSPNTSYSFSVTPQDSETTATLRVSDSRGNTTVSTQYVVLGTDDIDFPLTGTNSDDFIYGFGDENSLEGGLGADWFNPGSGNHTEVTDAGLGADTVYSDSADTNLSIRVVGEDLVTITVLDGFSSLTSAEGIAAHVDATSSIVHVHMQSYNSNPSVGVDFTGGNAGDDLYGGDGSDTLLGGNGDDTTGGLSGADYMTGGNGNDLFFIQAVIGSGSDSPELGQDTISDLESGDLIWLYIVNVNDFDVERDVTGDTNLYQMDTNQDGAFSYASDIVINVSGVSLTDLEAIQYTKISASCTDAADQVYGGMNNDTIDGRYGNDTLDGRAGADLIWGGPGDDVVSGGEGDDLIEGGEGDDTIDGGDGNDVIYGNDGLDIITGGAGADWMSGRNYISSGSDTAVFVIASGSDTRGVGYSGSNISWSNIDRVTNFNGQGTSAGDLFNFGLGADAFGAGITFTGITTVTVIAVTIDGGAVANLDAIFDQITVAVPSGGVASTSANAQIYDVTLTTAFEGANRLLIINNHVAGIDSTDAVINITGVAQALDASDFTFG